MAPPKRKGGRTLPATPSSSTSTTSRTTPGGSGAAARPAEAPSGATASTRYTPPTHNKNLEPSPSWVPILMGVLLVVGALMITLNYMEALPGAVSNAYLFGGLALIFGGIITATRWR